MRAPCIEVNCTGEEDHIIVPAEYEHESRTLNVDGQQTHADMQ